jgi:hypothetical protein
VCPKQHRIKVIVGPLGLASRSWNKLSTVNQGSYDGTRLEPDWGLAVPSETNFRAVMSSQEASSFVVVVIKAHMMVSFRRVTGVSTTTTNELASCEDITARKF